MFHASDRSGIEGHAHLGENIFGILLGVQVSKPYIAEVPSENKAKKHERTQLQHMEVARFSGF